MSHFSVRRADKGTVFEITIKDDGTAVDVSSSTTKEIIFQRSDGSILTKTAGFKTDGVDGVITYTTVVTDLTPAGIYKVQARVVVGGGDWKSDVHEFRVFEVLE